MDTTSRRFASTSSLLAERVRSPAAVYRPMENQLADQIMRRARRGSVEVLITKDDIRQMIRLLRHGQMVWYAPDQSYNRKGAEVIPFFGVPSMHTTATSTLARLGDAVTIPYFPRRLPDGTYRYTIEPALEDFPSGDPVADTQRYVAILEEQIRQCPEQYFWVHRKFKNLPDDYPDYYADLDATK